MHSPLTLANIEHEVFRTTAIVSQTIDPAARLWLSQQQKFSYFVGYFRDINRTPCHFSQYTFIEIRNESFDVLTDVLYRSYYDSYIVHDIRSAEQRQSKKKIFFVTDCTELVLK